MVGPDLVRRHAAHLGNGLARSLWLPVGYLLTVTVAGLLPPRATPCGSEPWPGRLTVLIPAHDEEAGIAATLQSVADALRPPGGLDVLVVADNCSDCTAEVARGWQAQVWERASPDRGKGHALHWALDRLLHEPSPPTAVAIIDADTRVDRDFFVAATSRLAAGAPVVQGVYRATAPVPGAGVVAQLTATAAACQSVLKPRGRARLGAAAKLQGNGMVFRSEVLRQVPWQARGLAEDVGYWFALLRAGVRPEHDPAAGVESGMPGDLGAARVQRRRWEAGRIEVRRDQLGPGLAQAVRTRDAVLAEAVLSELGFPPLAALAATVALAAVVASAHPAGRAGRRHAGAQTAVLLGHVLVSMRLTGAPVRDYVALAAAPLAVAWKLAVKLARPRGDGQWQRTPRRWDVVDS